MRRFAFVVSIAIAAMFTGAAAHAQNAVSVGTLTCTGGQGVGLILGSQKTYQCTFSPNNGRTVEEYRATVTKVGLDIGITGETVIVWTVLATTNTRQPGMLAGNYAGAAADAAIGIGGGAKVLVGGSSSSIVLQPLSVQGQSGVNLAVGIAGMSLR
ncbi:MAG TPA: DUF992 domain-containing protein [Hyphomicrobiaceae bacterium]|nr:DUF992 domain-containing protein [Hyphomicrobiaceae bacterium]